MCRARKLERGVRWGKRLRRGKAGRAGEHMESGSGKGTAWAEKG